MGPLIDRPLLVLSQALVIILASLYFVCSYVYIEKLDSIGVKSDSSKYSPEVNAIFPAKAYLQRFIDPKTDLTGTQPSILKKHHSFYENHIACNGKRSMSLLEVGGGPCIYSLITAAKYVDSITFSDYAETNRKEINLWKEERPERKTCY